MSTGDPGDGERSSGVDGAAASGGRQPASTDAAGFRAAFAQAAARSGVGKLAAQDQLSGRALVSAIGGVRGIAETVLPGLVFLIIYTFWHNVLIALAFSVGVALIFTIVRVATRSAPTQAIAGLIGVVASALLAIFTGKAENNFLLGIWLNAGYGLLILVSVAVRWPLIGVALGYLMGDGTAWRAQRGKFRAMQGITLLWVGLFAARLAVQVPLYLAHTQSSVEALALTKLLMGLPLYAPLVLVTWFVGRAVWPAADRPTAQSGSTLDGTGAEPEGGPAAPDAPHT